MLANYNIFKKSWLSYVLFNKDLKERLLKLEKLKSDMLINIITSS